MRFGAAPPTWARGSSRSGATAIEDGARVGQCPNEATLAGVGRAIERCRAVLQNTVQSDDGE